MFELSFFKLNSFFTSIRVYASIMSSLSHLNYVVFIFIRNLTLLHNADKWHVPLAGRDDVALFE